MPIGKRRNLLYGMALPVLGRQCEWKPKHGDALEKILHKRRAVGACIQRFEKGALTECRTVGFASLEGQKVPVAPDTVFRTASLAKTVTALLVMRLQTKGLLSVEEDASGFLGFSVRNPAHPDAPITLGMMLSHTSSIADPAAFHKQLGTASVQDLLKEPDAFLPAKPGERFKYSNFAAGVIACMLEKRFGMSIEALAQRELFEPMGVSATYDLTHAKDRTVADLYRVLPFEHAFDVKSRLLSAMPTDEPDPEHHYALTSGNLYISAPDLARLALIAWNGGEGFLDEKSLRDMHMPIKGWPEPEVNIRHGMGLLQIDDAKIGSRKIWGHQGFAYGAVNGIFFDGDGSGFVCLNSGASEQRIGHLALINRDLIRLWMNE